MPKPCVFCGQNPIKKNSEHVLPQWLIEMTGDLKRSLKIPFHAKLRHGLPVEISYDALRFPSCEKCNESFSDLEGKAKTIVKGMIDSEGLSRDEINIFLDWLDKVRTGLWLGGLYLTRNPLDVRPNFYIASRTGAKDRMVVIHRCGAGPRGLTSYGTTLPLFWYHPVCFSLAINHLSFLSVSTDFLFARRLGFPYPRSEAMTPEGLVSIELGPGLQRSILPLLKFRYASDGTELFQPMYHHKLTRQKGEKIDSLYQTEYVRQLSLSHSEGIGMPLIQADRTLKPYPQERTLDWLPKKESTFADFLRLIPIQTLGLQAKLIDDATVTKDQLKTFRMLRNVNLRALQEFKTTEIAPYQNFNFLPSAP